MSVNRALPHPDPVDINPLGGWAVELHHEAENYPFWAIHWDKQPVSVGESSMSSASLVAPSHVQWCLSKLQESLGFSCESI